MFNYNEDSYWDIFFQTGSIDAYLLTRQSEQSHQPQDEKEFFVHDDEIL
ncbi:YqzL family protein [Bacillus piscicola]|nr:YqzL family protein [Bacillus piscicola]